MGRVLPLFLLVFLLNSTKAAAQLRLAPTGDTLSKPIKIQVLPQNFYNQHLSFFCKKEIQLQKLSSLPLYFRLGSKEQVDYLEKKPHAVAFK